jgi:DNA repair protein RecO (recombination protein O)
MALYREQGIVLRTHKLGETDRIVHVLTQGRGKVRAVAKGVRRPGSRFGGRLEPYSLVDLQVYEGRNLDVINQAELIAPFAQVRSDFALSACGSTMVEGADRVAQEDERSTPLFLLLLDGLRALSTAPPRPSMVLDAYLLRLASVAGYHPYLDACSACGTVEGQMIFHIAGGGLLCTRCAAQGGQQLRPGVLGLLRRLVAAPWDALDDPVGDDRDRRRAAALVNSYLTYHLGRPLKAWDLVPR